jgi:hypothetical protein
MKKLFFLSAILLAGMVSHAQTDSLYMVTYTTGPAWDANKQPQEQPWLRNILPTYLNLERME